MNKATRIPPVNKGKVYNTKPTARQIKAVNNLLENPGSMGKAMLDAGYSPAMAKNPAELTSSKGFRALADSLGLTDDFIAQALAEDIRSKPGNRVAELALAAKVRGLMIDRSLNESISVISVRFGTDK